MAHFCHQTSGVNYNESHSVFVYVWLLTAFKPHLSFFLFCPSNGHIGKKAWVFFPLVWVGESNPASPLPSLEPSHWPHLLTTMKTWGQPPFLALSSHFRSAWDCPVLPFSLREYLSNKYMSNKSLPTFVVCVCGIITFYTQIKFWVGIHSGFVVQWPPQNPISLTYLAVWSLAVTQSL